MDTRHRVKQHVKLNICLNNLPALSSSSPVAVLCFHLSFEVMQFCFPLLILWSNVGACGGLMCMACPTCPGQLQIRFRKLYLNQRKQKAVWMLELSSQLSQILLIYDCVMYFQLPVIFTITMCASHLSFPLWICQRLEVNTSEIREGKDIKKKKQKNFLGGQREKAIFPVCEWDWRGLSGGNRPNKGCPGTLLGPFMLS